MQLGTFGYTVQPVYNQTTLGPLLELTASTQGGIRPVYGLQMQRITPALPAQAPTSVESGPITISVSVQARWQFVPSNQ